MSRLHETAALVKELVEMGGNPDIHPIFRGVAQTAARVIQELAAEVDARRRPAR